MTKKKQRSQSQSKSKKSALPGVFISSLLGEAREEIKDNKQVKAAGKQEAGIEHKEFSEKVKLSGDTTIWSYQEAILYRTVLELALLNLAQNLQPNKNTEMAPATKETVPPAISSLSKLMSPVQDLGRSLLSFLVGSPQQTEVTQAASPNKRGSAAVVSHRDSLTPLNRGDSAASATPGRLRPLGHPANPPIHSTPVVIRRAKAEKPITISSDSHEDTAQGRLEAATPKPCTQALAPEICISPEPRPPSSKRKRKKNKRGVEQVREPGLTGSSSKPPLTEQSTKEKFDKKQSPDGQLAVNVASKEPALNTKADDKCTDYRETKIEINCRAADIQAPEVRAPINELNEQSDTINDQENKSGRSLPMLDDLLSIEEKSSHYSNEALLLKKTGEDKIVLESQVDDINERYFESESEVTEITGCRRKSSVCGDETFLSDNIDTVKSPGSRASNEINTVIDDTNKICCVLAKCECEKGSSLNPGIPKTILDTDFGNPVPTSDNSLPAQSVSLNETSVEVTPTDPCQEQQVKQNSPLCPPPPPLPPVGFLTEGLKITNNTESGEPTTGTLKKNKQLSREGALLEQLSSLDDTFASFLRSNLSIKANIGRERDEVSENRSVQTKVGDNLKRKKEGKIKNNSECSEGEKLTDSLPVSTEDKPEGVSPCGNDGNCNVLNQDSDHEMTHEKGSTERKIDDKIHVGSNAPEARKRVGSNASNLKRREDPSPKTEHLVPTGGTVTDQFISLRKRVGSNASESSKRVGSNPSNVKRRSSIINCETNRERPVSFAEKSEQHQNEESRTSLEEEEHPQLSGGTALDIVGNERNHSNTTISNIDDKIAISLIPDQRDNTVNTVSPDQISNISRVDWCAEQPSTDISCPPVHDMTVSNPGTLAAHQTPDSNEMGAAQSAKDVSVGVKQILAKSDSGYSGHISAEDDEQDQPIKRKELTVEQAMLRYDKRVSSSAPPAAIPLVEKEKQQRARVLSEGTDYSECDDSELDDSDFDDGVTRRARDTRSFNSRRSSTDSSEDGFNQNVRDLKQEVKDLEEKFRKAMVANASLDNEKCQLMFQVDLLKDQVEEGEEQAALVVKELRAKTHDYELLKRDHADSVRAVQLLQAALTEQQAMLQERGLVLLGPGEEGGLEENEVMDETEQEKRTRAIVSQETANILAGLGSGPLDVRIKRLAGQRDDLQDTVRRLKLDLEEERSRSSLARGAASQEDIERETKKLLDDYKFKISKSEQEIATLSANVARLESQVVRFKTASETAELSEENLKSERRKMQREMRDTATRNEELETQNKHLEKRLDKLKTAKSNLLKELE